MSKNNKTFEKFSEWYEDEWENDVRDGKRKRKDDWVKQARRKKDAERERFFENDE